MRWFANKMGLLLALTAVLGIGCADVQAQGAGVPNPEQVLPEWSDLSVAYDAGVAASGSPVENLTLPIEHFDSGRVRAVLHAQQATIADEDYVRAGQVRITLFNEFGKQEGWVTAEHCLFNRNEKRGYCRGKVTLELQEVVVSGKDLYWSLVQQRVVVISDARVVVKQWKRNAEQGE